MSEPDPSQYLIDLLDRLCSGLLKRLEETDLGRHPGSFSPPPEFPPRAAEAMYPFAVLHAKTGRPELLAAATDLGAWLIPRQREAGFWFESAHSRWHGCTIFLLMAQAATYSLIRETLRPEADAAWRTSIARAAAWVIRYQPVSHVRQTLGSIAGKLRRDPVRGMTHRFLNTNYLATIPTALRYAWNALGDDRLLERNRALAATVLDRAAPDGLLGGEDAEAAPKVCKIFRRSDTIDLGYNLDMTLGALAVYADMAEDEALLTEVRRLADAHLTFLYPDGSVDNSMGSRGYKSVYFGSETAHGLQMLCSVLRRFDARYDRASRLNAALLAASVEDGIVQRGPYRQCPSRRTQSLYPTFARASNLALAIEHFHRGEPAEDTPLFCEGTHGTARFDSLNTVVVMRSPFMATASGVRKHSSHLPYRFMTPAGGGSLSALYHGDYGPLQLGSPYVYRQIEADFMPADAEKEPITPRIELVGTGYTNQHDTRVSLSVRDGSITAAGRLTRRLTLLRRHRYVMTYRFDGEGLRKEYVVEGLCARDRILILEPVVLSDAVTGTALQGNAMTVATPRSIVTVTAAVDQPEAAIRLRPIVTAHAPPVRVQPFEILLRGPGTATAAVTIRVESASTEGPVTTESWLPQGLR